MKYSFHPEAESEFVHAIEYHEECKEGQAMQYAIVIEKAGNNYSAYVPDLPGCVSTGETVEEVRKNIKDAIDFHLEGLKEDGLPLPRPETVCDYVESAADAMD